MRKLHTLYKIVLEEIPIRNRGNDYGLCHMIQDGKYTGNKNHLTREEELRLTEYMKALRPLREKYHPFKEFAWNRQYRWDNDWDTPKGSYWWECNEEGKAQRLLFLKALIEHTTPWYVKLWKKLNYFDVFTKIYVKG